MPTKEVCQKCHHGKIHGKFLIFKADCIEQKDTAHCVKCHPYFKPEMLIAEKKEVIVEEEIAEEIQ
jgi:hypothetical protein